MDTITHYTIDKIQQNLKKLQQDSDHSYTRADFSKENLFLPKGASSNMRDSQNILVFDNFEKPNKLIIETAGHPVIKLDFNFTGFIKKGTMTIRIGHKKYNLKPNDWFMVLSGKMYQAIHVSPDAKIGACCINDFFCNINPETTKAINVYNRLMDNPIIRFSDENADEYANCLIHLKKSTSNHNHPCRFELIKNYSNLLFLILCSELLNDKIIEQNKISRKEMIYQSFLQCIEKNYKKEHSVKFYADSLCITPKYLSSVIYQTSGKHASKWIDTQLISEAKALLKTTDMPIQEIAYDLHFSTPAHFGKFFRRLTGTSPKRYRVIV